MAIAAQKAKCGSEADVDFLMNILTEHTSLPECKITDYALSQVDTTEGSDRIGYYLFNGNPVQRNYAALYFKRRGDISILNKALAIQRIDEEQARAK